MNIKINLTKPEEFYMINDEGGIPEEDNKIISQLNYKISKYDYITKI